MILIRLGVIESSRLVLTESSEIPDNRLVTDDEGEDNYLVTDDDEILTTDDE